MKENQEVISNKVTEIELEVPDFSIAKSVDIAFNIFYSFLKQHLDVVELDLFLTEDNILLNESKTSDNLYNKIKDIPLSVSLENTYQDLEERGILEWAIAANEIKIIPNIDDNLKQINSIIIIPVTLLENTVAFFIANSPVSPTGINITILNHIKFIANHTFTLISMLRINAEKQKISSEHNQLKTQTILASNQIAVSEIFVAMNESFESPLKIIKANLDFIQKDVGDTKHRIKILAEQFNSFVNAQSFIQKLASEMECVATLHPINKIIEYALEVANPFLMKNGIVINYKHNPSVDKLHINGFKIQLVFAIFNTIMYSISTMPEGGTISLLVDTNSDNDSATIIIMDDGNGIYNTSNDGNFVYAVDMSSQKMQMQFLFNVSQNIIIKHQGKFSTFCQEGKGTTHKITLPTTTA